MNENRPQLSDPARRFDRDAAPPGRSGTAELNAALQGLEVVFLLGYLLYFIWVLGPHTGSQVWSGVAFFVGFIALSAWLHGNRLADLGIRFDTFPRAMKESFVVIAPALVLAFIIGRYMDGGRTINIERYAAAFVKVYPWALFQQFGMLCFFSMRLRGALKDPHAHDVVCAGIFAALHLPNPFLTAVTFGAGYCFCVLFRRCPNLFAIGAAHALSSATLYFCLPPAITHLMKVGPGYLLDLQIR